MALIVGGGTRTRLWSYPMLRALLTCRDIRRITLQSLLTQIQTLEVDNSLIKTHLPEFAAAFVAYKTVSLKEACDLVVDRFPMFLLV